MGKNTHIVQSIPKPREVTVMQQQFLQSEAHKSDAYFAMEQYFQWLEGSPYFKYINHSADMNYEFKVNKESKRAILWFGRFVLNGHHDGIDIAFCNECIYLTRYNIGLPFKTLEAAKEATSMAIEFLLSPPAKADNAGKLQEKFEQKCDRLLELLKGSGLRYILKKDGSKGTLYISLISVAEAMQSNNHNVLKFNFSASTKDSDLQQIAHYVLKYKRFNDMYKVFNCQVTL